MTTQKHRRKTSKPQPRNKKKHAKAPPRVCLGGAVRAAGMLAAKRRKRRLWRKRQGQGEAQQVARGEA